jgi:hypothetical protein
LPGRKFALFNELRAMMTGKIFIIKWLQLNYSRQMGYGLNDETPALGRGFS